MPGIRQAFDHLMTMGIEPALVKSVALAGAADDIPTITATFFYPVEATPEQLRLVAARIAERAEALEQERSAPKLEHDPQGLPQGFRVQSDRDGGLFLDHSAADCNFDHEKSYAEGDPDWTLPELVKIARAHEEQEHV